METEGWEEDAMAQGSPVRGNRGQAQDLSRERFPLPPLYTIAPNLLVQRFSFRFPKCISSFPNPIPLQIFNKFPTLQVVPYLDEDLLGPWQSGFLLARQAVSLHDAAPLA